MVNIYASIQVGVDRFDAALAASGGCPHAPGASGKAEGAITKQENVIVPTTPEAALLYFKSKLVKNADFKLD